MRKHGPVFYEVVHRGRVIARHRNKDGVVIARFLFPDATTFRRWAREMNYVPVQTGSRV